MKKIMLLAVAILFLFNFSFATNNPAVENTNKVVNVITKILEYPLSAQDNSVQGYVLLSLSIDENGIVDVKQIYSNKKELKDYVQQKLNSIIINDLTYVPDQTYDMKIVFKLL
jgi:hypothetical protein